MPPSARRTGSGLLQSVAFLSKKMNAAQRNYPVHEWELLAVMEALKAWRCFLYGAAAPIDIFTDYRLPAVDQHPAQPVSATEPVGGAAAGLLVHGPLPRLEDKNGAADALSRRADHEAAHAAEAEARLRAGDAEASRERLRLQVAALTRSRAAPAMGRGRRSASGLRMRARASPCVGQGRW